MNGRFWKLAAVLAMVVMVAGCARGPRKPPATQPEATARPADAVLAAGDTWKYKFREQFFRGTDYFFTVKVDGVEGASIKETFESGSEARSTNAFDAQELRFIARTVGQGQAAIELAPYLVHGKLEKAL